MKNKSVNVLNSIKEKNQVSVIAKDQLEVIKGGYIVTEDLIDV